MQNFLRSVCSPLLFILLYLQRDDEEAAKVYEEFVKDFGGDDDEPEKKGFVSGGVIQPGQTPGSTNAGSGSADKPAFGGRRHYVPPYVPPPKDEPPGDTAEQVRFYSNFAYFFFPTIFKFLKFSLSFLFCSRCSNLQLQPAASPGRWIFS